MAMVCSVSIRGLRKVYETNAEDRVAVQGLDLDLFSGQVTVLLGHNGAGKSTTISMLCGLIAPSAGEAYVLGKRISQDMNQIRTNLGGKLAFDHVALNIITENHIMASE